MSAHPSFAAGRTWSFMTSSEIYPSCPTEMVQASIVEDQIAAPVKADRVLGSAAAATNLTLQLFIFFWNNLP